MRASRLVLLSALALMLALPVLQPAFAENQPQSAVPEVPAGSNPEPNGQQGQPGTPESNSANPEVPAGNTPQPNP